MICTPLFSTKLIISSENKNIAIVKFNLAEAGFNGTIFQIHIAYISAQKASKFKNFGKIDFEDTLLTVYTCICDTF